MPKFQQLPSNAQSYDIEDAFLWWFLECDEFDWYIMIDGSLEQILLITSIVDRDKYNLITYNGYQVNSRICGTENHLWKVLESGR